MRSRLPGVLLAVLVAWLAIATVALADGDPASDVLLGDNVFYPYSPPVSAALQKTLNAQTAAAKRAHFPLKVALIAAPVDLGVIPDLFGKPQKYAEFLDQEISYQNFKQPLLVVMAAGYGVEGVSPLAAKAAAALPKPAGGSTDDLARAAITALGKLSAAAGHPVGSTGSSGATAGGNSQTVLLVVLVVAAVATASALLALRWRRATSRR